MQAFIVARSTIFLRRISEVVPACLMVVQGNITAITPEHWLVALKTGCLTGVGAIIVSFIKNDDMRDNKFVMAGMVGFLTAVADFLVHPSHFGGEHTEALVTGIAAGLLCILFSGIGQKRA